VVLKEVRDTEEVNGEVYWYLQWHVFAGHFVAMFVLIRNEEESMFIRNTHSEYMCVAAPPFQLCFKSLREVAQPLNTFFFLFILPSSPRFC